MTLASSEMWVTPHPTPLSGATFLPAKPARKGRRGARADAGLIAILCLAAPLSPWISPTLAAAQSCAVEQGARRAADYLRQCRDLAAPRERRACDDAKPCAALIEQIARGCEALGADGPDFCSLYALDGEADADPDMDE